MKKDQLDALKVASIVKAAKPGYTADGRGLYLQITRYGTANWVFRYGVDGRTREMGLGSLRDVTLKKARDEATKHRETLLAFRHGETEQDPLAKRRADLQRRKIETATRSEGPR